MTHGFFVSMGGFMLYGDNTDHPHPLSPDDLELFVKRGDIELPTITEKELKDKSKGDGVSKAFVMVQTIWFILQTVARRVEHLPITELELVTVAFSILSLAVYLLWWDKPLNVRCAVPVAKSPVRSYSRSEEEAEGNDERDNDARERESPINLAKAMVREVLRPIEEAVHNGKLERDRYWSANGLGVWATASRRAWGAVRHGVLLPIASLIIEIFNMGWSGDITASQTKVPAFYAGKLTNDEGLLCVVVLSVFAMTFGCIHCIAWSFSFPSDIEKVLWRISSLVITCVPAFYLSLFGILSLGFRFGFPHLPSWLESLLKKVFLMTLILCALLYLAARFMLLTQPFISLRSLPKEAYQQVYWTTLLPHL